MSKSVKRVEKAARGAGLSISVRRMAEGTRTAQDAAAACGCDLGQIVKSMVFEGAESGALKLLLISGAHEVDLSRAAGLFGEGLARGPQAGSCGNGLRDRWRGADRASVGNRDMDGCNAAFP